MTAPGGDALFRLRWEQENARVPEQARAQLLGLTNANKALAQSSLAAAASGAGLVDQFGRPFVAAMGDAGSAARQAGQLAEGAGHGFNHVQRAMSVVALEAAGASGPVGHLGNALLMFGTGGIVTLTAAAGLAVIAAGYRLVTKDARDAAESQGHFVDKLHEAVAARVPEQDKLAQARLDLTNARELRARFDDPHRIGRGVDDLVAMRDADNAIAAAQKLVEQLEGPAQREHKKAGQGAAQEFLEGFQERFATATVPALAALITDLQAKIAAGGAQAAAKFGPLLQQASAELIGATPHPDNVRGFRPPSFGAATGFPGFNAPVVGSFQSAARTAQAAAEQDHYAHALDLTRGILLRAQTPQQIFNTGLSVLQEALNAGAISTEQFDEGVKQLNEDLKKATKNTTVLAASIVTAVSGAIAAVVSGGSAGGILSGIGGIIGLIPGGQLAGAVIGGLGTVISASQSRGVSIDRYSKEALDQLKGIPNGPQRIDFSVVAASTGEIVERVIYELGQRQRNGAVRRALPGYALAG